MAEFSNSPHKDVFAFLAELNPNFGDHTMNQVVQILSWAPGKTTEELIEKFKNDSDLQDKLKILEKKEYIRKEEDSAGITRWHISSKKRPFATAVGATPGDRYNQTHGREH